LKAVNNAIGQRSLRSDNDKLDALFSGCFSQRLYIGRFDIQIMAKPGGASVTRGDVNLFRFRALG